MKKLNVFIIILLSIFLFTGCGVLDSFIKEVPLKNKKENTVYQYNDKALKDGLKYVSEGKLDKAKNKFQEAIDFNNKDQKAESYLEQLSYVLSGDKLIKDNKLSEAEINYKKAIKFKKGSSLIMGKANMKIKQLQDRKKLEKDKLEQNNHKETINSEDPNKVYKRKQEEPEKILKPTHEEIYYGAVSTSYAYKLLIDYFGFNKGLTDDEVSPEGIKTFVLTFDSDSDITQEMKDKATDISRQVFYYNESVLIQFVIDDGNIRTVFAVQKGLILVNQ